jgi:hypothetical protein
MRNDPGSYWLQKRVKVGRHQLEVKRAGRKGVGIFWVLDDVSVRMATWDGTNARVSNAANGNRVNAGYKVWPYPRGTTAVIQLIKAAFKEAYGVEASPFQGR